MKLAIITTHPIQYYAPVFELIHSRNKIQQKIFYTWGDEVLKSKYDPGFDKIVKWDIPLLDGYEYEFLQNIAAKPGSDHYSGIINPHIIERVESYKPDAVLIIGWNFKSHLKVMRHFKGKVPVWFRGDSTLLDEKKGFSIKKIARRIALKNIYSNINKAFYTGSANKEYFLKHGVKPDQLIYAPHAVDNRRFAVSDNDEIKEQRSALSIMSNDKVFLFAGKLEHKKDPILLMEGFVDAVITNCHLIIAGDGILKAEIIQYIENNNDGLLSMNKKIHLLPFQNQASMPGLYQTADIFVLPSKGPGETWGLAVNEAMASGLAVIVSDKCGCATDLVNDNTGYIFEAGNKKGLVSKLESSVWSAERLVEQKKAAKEKMNDFSILHVVEAIENTLLSSN